MANPEQVVLLLKSVEDWNKWRKDNPEIAVNLDDAYLSGVSLFQADFHKSTLQGADLRGADLRGADLRGVNLKGANLKGTNLKGANLRGANFLHASLQEAHLKLADLRGANLIGANLTKAVISQANLIKADLSGANLSSANLNATDLREANLIKAELSCVFLGHTVFANIDLSQTLGLEAVVHQAPSTIGLDTIQLSKGKIPVIFLRGCGLTDWEIESAKLYDPELSNQEIDEILYKVHDLRATQALQISPLFISYSQADSLFVDALEVHLNKKGIRFWRDVHDATAGRLEKQIDRAIRQNPTVLVILSKNSTQSDWVEHEVRTARGLEKELGRDILCPIALDDSWKTSPWPKRVMEQVMEYNILDFSAWKDTKTFQQMFIKLLDGLQLFYK
jgi:hypothetical protein